MTYLYEQLSPEKFQQFCQALISAEFPNTQCFPVAQPDGGRDATAWSNLSHSNRALDFIAFQVKFSRDSERINEDFLKDILSNELPKVETLKTKGLKAYYLVTNVRGTAHLDSGTIDRMQKLLSDSLGIPAFCWWRDDIDRRVDARADLKWSYPEIIRGSDLLQALLSGALGEEGRRRDNAVRAYLAEQYREDREVKFKQVDLFNNLLDLFVDTNLGHVGSSEDVHRFGSSNAYYQSDHYYERMPRAASRILNLAATTQRVVLEGAPGQGKSTITQYVCQVHRIRLLDHPFDRSKIPDQHLAGTLRIPMRVDLRDFASWISGKNPFASDASSPRPNEAPISLEGFLAFQISQVSGGHAFSVSDLASLARESHLLIVLDGFDEVADISTREQVVREISKSATRLEASSKSLLIVVTSRPAAFAKSPGFPHNEWDHVALFSMTMEQINSYADKWMSARTLPQLEKEKFKLVLREKLDQAHMRDLARNPMQLAILLSLIQTKGLSLPDKRTALYDSYVDLFFSREAEKSPIVREHRDLLIELHRYLAWVIQTEAEGRRSAGSVTEDRLKVLLQDYLAKEGHQTTLVDDLFTGMTERVVALVSRVQGTFEFEVQPLREYFAARHLYETAPYSPPGRERSGTKPERFDALARNFYWLNVTRFYCGCYSRGELSSLADGLIQLSEVEDLKEVSYPRVLIMMLLSDWVFTQQPYIIKRLLAYLVIQPGLRILLANVSRDRVSTALLPPERCGRDDLLQAVAVWFNGGIQSDVCMALALSMREGLSIEQATNFWKKLHRHDAHNWFLFGRFVGAFAHTDLTEAKILFEQHGEVLIRNLDFSERYDLVEADQAMFEMAVREALLNGGAMPVSKPTLQRSSVLGALGASLDLATYTVLFERDLKGVVSTGHSYRSLINSSRSLPITLERPDLKTLEFDSRTYESCVRFIREFYDQIELPSAEWAVTLRPWSAIVQAGIAEWGPSPIFTSIALIAAGINSKGERGNFGASFDDQSVPLCEKIRFARLKSGAPQWWTTQLELAKSHHELALTTLLCWATTRTILQVGGLIERQIDSLDDTSWSLLLERVRRGARTGGTGESLDGISATASDRLFLILALRVFGDQGDDIIVLRFRHYSGKDARIIEAMCDSSTRLASRYPEKWKEAVEIVQRAYSMGINTGQVLGRMRGDLNIPKKAAKLVCQSANEFPLSLIYFAQSALQSNLAGKIGEPLGELSHRDNWFVDL